MKHSKLINWLTAAAFSLCTATALSAGIPAAAATGTGTTSSGLAYTYDTVTQEATITGYSGASNNVTIPSSINGYTVTKIGDKAFFRKAVSTVSIPQTVTSIGKRAFLRTSLQSLSLPSGVTTVSEAAFYGCSKLTTLSLPYVTSLRKWP